MAGNPLIFKDADKVKDAILASQKKEIIKLYNEWAAEIGERAKYYSHKSASSYAVAERQMKELMKQMEATSQQVANEVYKGVKNNIYLVADSVVQQNNEWLKSLGFENNIIDAAFNYVPDDIVQKLITGQIYNEGWSLSKRIWSDNEDTMKQAYQLVAGGMAQNKSIYEIARELEKYVQPGAKKPWNLKDKDGRRIYPKQVDYNAQRLGRTLVQHGYQQSFVATTKKNPFITDYIWRSNGSRVCELCSARDGQHFSKDDLPMDHPNGMCTMEPNVNENLVDDLANWFNEPDGTYPEIDEFAKNFGYDAKDYIDVQSKKQRLPYTDKQIKSASKFLKEFEFEKTSVDSYMKTLKSTEQEFQNVFIDALKKKVKNWDYSDDGTSFYSSFRKEINLNDESINAWLFDLQDTSIHLKQTLFHEVGHAIDDLAPGGSNARFSKSSKFKFKTAMMKDMKEMNNKVKSNDVDFIKALNAMIKDSSSKGVQDAISAMHCEGIELKDVKTRVRVNWSHSQDYYERSNAKNEAASELFANICGAKADPKAQEHMKKYFPNAVEEFERIIKEIGK